MGVIVYQVSGHTIDALAIGDFGSGPRLIVGMNADFGGSVIWSFTTSRYPSWSWLFGYDYNRDVVEVAAADFGDDGDGDIAYGFNLKSGGTRVYVSDFQFSLGQTALNLPFPYEVTALTGGDYNANGRASLISAVSWQAFRLTGSTIFRHLGGTSNKTTISGWDWTRIVGSMATGDFLGQSEPGDELVVGFINHYWNATTRYSADGYSLTTHPIVTDLPSSYYCNGPYICQGNARLLVASFGR
jgi:hypothetical protein